MPDSAPMLTDVADDTLVIVRRFAAPRALVFAAWTDPAQVLRWMGPRDHPAVHYEQGTQVGDAWRGCLRPVAGGPDLWQGGVLRELVPPERLAFTFAWDNTDIGSSETLVEVRFEEQDGGTLMTFRQSPFRSVPERDGHHGGWTSVFDRLAEHLATLA